MNHQPPPLITVPLDLSAGGLHEAPVERNVGATVPEQDAGDRHAPDEPRRVAHLEAARGRIEVVLSDNAEIRKLMAAALLLPPVGSITGNAFPGLEVEGVVSSVAPEADPRARGIAKFDVVVTLEPLEAAQRARESTRARVQQRH